MDLINQITIKKGGLDESSPYIRRVKILQNKASPFSMDLINHTPTKDKSKTCKTQRWA